MSTKNDLDRFRGKTDSRRPVAALLEEAGLEVGRTPDGFWMIRAKPGAAVPRRRRAR